MDQRSVIIQRNGIWLSQMAYFKYHGTSFLIKNIDQVNGHRLPGSIKRSDNSGTSSIVDEAVISVG